MSVRSRGWLPIAGGIAGFALLAVVGSGVLMRTSFSGFETERSALGKKIKPGMSESDLKRSLGPPRDVQSPATGQRTCSLPGYSHTQKPISHRCLIYLGGRDAIAYVYVDHEGRVEDVFVGGS